MQEFLSLAEMKKAEILGVLDVSPLVKALLMYVMSFLKSLQRSVPDTLKELSNVVEVLQEASSWFPGGYREMKEDIALYRLVEKRIDSMTECVQVLVIQWL